MQKIKKRRKEGKVVEAVRLWMTINHVLVVLQTPRQILLIISNLKASLTNNTKFFKESLKILVGL